MSEGSETNYSEKRLGSLGLKLFYFISLEKDSSTVPSQSQLMFSYQDLRTSSNSQLLYSLSGLIPLIIVQNKVFVANIILAKGRTGALG